MAEPPPQESGLGRGKAPRLLKRTPACHRLVGLGLSRPPCGVQCFPVFML